AAVPSSARSHAGQLKASVTIEVEDLLRLRHLEGQPSDPVDYVAPWRHSAHARLRVRSPAAERGEAHGVASDGRAPEAHERRKDYQPSQRPRKTVVETLDLQPSPARAALIVVDRDAQASAGLDERGNVAQRVPHTSSVMEYAPGIDDIVPAELVEKACVEHRTLLDRPSGVVREVTSPQLPRAAD